MSWLSLIDHSADVAAVFEAIVEVPLVGERLGALAARCVDGQERQRLCAYAALHDFGKGNAGFQARWRTEVPLVGHCTEALIALKPGGMPDTLCQALPLLEMQAWGAFDNAILVALGHHGRPLDPLVSVGDHMRHWTPRADYDPVQALVPLGHAAKAWFPEAFGPGGQPLPARAAFWHAVSGLLTLADWIASDESFFPLLPLFEGGDAPTRMAESRHKAPEILRAIGFDPTSPRSTVPTSAGFSAISPFPPRPIQQATGEWGEEASIVVLESETGSGKTEAALYRFARLFAAGKVDGLYFALPTRVAATSLHARVVAAVERLFPDPANRPHVVLAVPGVAPVENVATPAIVPPQGGIDAWEPPLIEQPQAALWAADRPKKFLAGTIAVGTIDQALLSIVRVKHAHLRLASLDRHFLVVDEVHASDLYMSELLGALLRFHRAAGGHALLLSATLGANARSSLLGAPAVPALADALAAPYPALSSERRPDPVAQPWEGRDKRVFLALSPDIADAERIAARALDAARQGAKVLVIRNLRREAVAVFEALMKLAPDDPVLFRCGGVPTLHHGRFAREDRARLDASVEGSVGRVRPDGGLVLIGTQTLEQSLDIDGDYLITDLAPADVLLQRLGRLHRHMDRTGRPERFEGPSALVLAPLAMESLFGRGRHGMGGDENPYTDLIGLEATRQLIDAHPEWQIPAMNRLLVERATHPEARHDLLTHLLAKDPGWTTANERKAGKDFAMLGAGSHAILDTAVPFSSPDIVFPADEIVATRLGTRDLAISLPAPEQGPFGVGVQHLTIPQYWLAGAEAGGDLTPQITARDPHGFEFAFAGLPFRYDHRGLARLWTARS